jgi:hypothetical protein
MSLTITGYPELTLLGAAVEAFLQRLRTVSSTLEGSPITRNIHSQIQSEIDMAENLLKQINEARF